MNTTQELFARVENTAHEMAGSLKIHNESFAAEHVAVIDADLAELRKRCDEALRVRDLAREASQRDLEAKREAEARVAELERALGVIAAECVVDGAVDRNGVYHQCYMALVGDLTLPANEQAEIMRAAIDAARATESGEPKSNA